MSCAWSAKLDRYLDGDLSGGEWLEVQEHLAACQTCAMDALGRLQLKRVTQAAAAQRYRPAPEFRLKIERSAGSTRRPGWRWIPALATAAALVLVIALAGLWFQHARDEQSLGELADLHVATLASANPVDVVSTDRHTVKPWFQGKLAFSFNLPDLQGSAFKLIGGRVAYFQQSSGAQLLYELGKHEISVFIFQNRGELSRLNSLNSLRRKLALSSETWTEGGLWYFVIGDANSADIQGLSEMLKRAERS